MIIKIIHLGLTLIIGMSLYKKTKEILEKQNGNV